MLLVCDFDSSDSHICQTRLEPKFTREQVASCRKRICGDAKNSQTMRLVWDGAQQTNTKTMRHMLNRQITTNLHVSSWWTVSVQVSQAAHVSTETSFFSVSFCALHDVFMHFRSSGRVQKSLVEADAVKVVT